MASQTRRRKQDESKDNTPSQPANETEAKSGETRAQVVVSYLSAREILQACILLLVLCLTSGASKATLHPLYGSILASNWFRVGVFASVAFISLLSGREDRNGSSIKLLKYSAFLSLLSPLTATYVGQKVFDTVENPVLGPLVVHSFVGFPVLGFGGAAFLQWMVRVPSY